MLTFLFLPVYRFLTLLVCSLIIFFNISIDMSMLKCHFIVVYFFGGLIQNFLHFIWYLQTDLAGSVIQKNECVWVHEMFTLSNLVSIRKIYLNMRLFFENSSDCNMINIRKYLHC
jgi:hypothetical protein